MPKYPQLADTDVSGNPTKQTEKTKNYKLTPAISKLTRTYTQYLFHIPSKERTARKIHFIGNFGNV